MQNLAAEKGAEGLQAWMDKQGMGASVMTAAKAQESREKVLNLLLQRVVMIQNYEQMRGCV